MKIIGLEEHVVVPELLAAWSRLPDAEKTPELGFGDSDIAQRRRDTGDRRLKEMNDQGVDLQVLSLTTPGVQTGLQPYQPARAGRNSSWTHWRKLVAPMIAVAHGATTTFRTSAAPSPRSCAAGRC